MCLKRFCEILTTHHHKGVERNTSLSMLWVTVIRICNLCMKTPGIHGPQLHITATSGGLLWGGIPRLFSTCPIISHCNLPCFVLSEGPNLQHLAPTELSKKIDGALRRILGSYYQKENKASISKNAFFKRITTTQCLCKVVELHILASLSSRLDEWNG